MNYGLLPTVSTTTANWWWCTHTTGGREAMP